MANLNYLLLAVKDPLGSAALYDQLFGVAPVERAQTFGSTCSPVASRWASGRRPT
jgi:hypothetical protein